MSKRSLVGTLSHCARFRCWRHSLAGLIAALLLLWGLDNPASADDGGGGCDFPASPGLSLTEIISLALEREPGCKKNEEFLFSLGQKLNQGREYSEAIDRLEAAILLNPSHWAAHLEYAIALEGIGDTVSVDGILRNLLTVEKIGASLKGQIKAQLEKRQTVVGPNLVNRTTLGLVAGYDDNLKGAARVSSFDLTLPAGRIPVTLGEDSQPKAGRFMRLSFEHEGYVRQGGGDQALSYAIHANYRLSPEYSQANFGLIQLMLERSHAEHKGVYYSGGVLLMQAPDGALLRHYKLGAGYDAQGLSGPCRIRGGADLERRSYPDTDALNGYYLGGMSYLACPSLGFQAQVRFGQDRPEYDNRPGGIQNQYTMRLSKNTTWGPGNLVAEIEYYRQEDQRGYSPLLENNLRRIINRSLYRLEYRTQIADLAPYVGIEHVDQSANLSLFRIANQVIYVGIKAVW